MGNIEITRGYYMIYYYSLTPDYPALFGILEIDKHTDTGLTLGVISGIGGVIPFLVHKVIVKRRENFNLLISNAVIYLNIITGAGTFLLSADLIN